MAALAPVAHAQVHPPPDVVIRTPAEAQAFSDAAPFVFEGQSLRVHSSFSTEAPILLQRRAPIWVAADTQFELLGAVGAQAVPLAAPLEKTGPGTLVLKGDNDYTSVTALREGSLRVAGLSALGNPSYNLQQNAGTTLMLEADSQLFNGIQVQKTRPGDTPMPGLIDHVEWRVDAGSAALSGRVTAGVGIRKTGAGTLRLSNALHGHVPFWVDEGVVAADDAFSAYVEVARAARLEGTGLLVEARIRGGGTVAPGGLNDANTLSLSGNLHFEPEGIYHVNAYPDGRADQLEVGGEARLAGQVLVAAAAGAWAPEQHYTILTADGGLEGTRFDSVTSDLVFLDPALAYDSKAVYLTLQRNDLDIGDVGDTPDDKDVGDVIDPPRDDDPDPDGPGPSDPPPPGPPDPTPKDPTPEDPTPEDPTPEDPTPEDPTPEDPRVKDPDPSGPTPEDPPPSQPDDPGAPLPDPTPDTPIDTPTAEPDPDPTVPLSPLQEAVLTLDRGQASRALRQLSGSWHASVQSLLLEQGRYVREAVLADAYGSRQNDALGLSGSVTSDTGTRRWMQAYGATGRRGSVGGVAGDRHDTQGLVLGLNAPAGQAWRLGLVLAGQQARLRRDGGQASATMNSAYGGVTAQGRWDGMSVVAGLLHAWHRVESRRRLSAGTLQNMLASTYGGRSWQVFMEILPHLRSVGGWGRYLHDDASGPSGPYLRYAGMGLQTRAFQESGGVGAHDVRASRHAAHATTLGWRHAHHGMWNGRAYRINADINWRHVWSGSELVSRQRFLAQPRSAATREFTSSGLPLLRDGVGVGLAAEMAMSKQAGLSLRYSGLFGRAYRDHAAWAGFSWVF